MENSEGWYKIAYNGGKTGYVPSESITQDKNLADEAKKSYTNYRIAQVTLSGESVRVRSAANTDADVIEELSDGTYVYVLSGENDFIKICYGDDYKEGTYQYFPSIHRRMDRKRQLSHKSNRKLQTQRQPLKEQKELPSKTQPQPTLQHLHRQHLHNQKKHSRLRHLHQRDNLS